MEHLPEYDYAQEWAEIAEELRKQQIADHKEKEKWRQRLKSLINTRALFRFLNEGHDGWSPIGIFTLSITLERNSYYSKVMPMAKVNGGLDDLRLHHQKECRREVGANHIFLQQWTHGEDSYSGYIAFPLSNRKYFIVSYSC